MSDVKTTEAPRKRGRPPLEWLTPEQVLSVPLGTCLLFDQGQRELRLTGRVLRVDGRVLVVERRDGDPFVLDVERVVRARVITSTLEPGDPVLLRGVPASEWRGGVVLVRGRKVLVETAGPSEWRLESELEHADDRAARESPLAVPQKPGPPADDPVVEVANQERFASERRSQEDPWAV